MASAVQAKPPAHVILTLDEIADAPPDVREWLYRHLETNYALEQDFVFDRDGSANAGEGLAICSAVEITRLLEVLSNDYLACQILFELGCEYCHPVTGERRRHEIPLSDFFHHTDAKSVFDVHRCLDAINAALRRLRGDPEATIYQRNGGGDYEVDERTQHEIYRLWRQLAHVNPEKKPPQSA